MALFVCKANTCRSQMAEGWVRALMPGVPVASAGTEPAPDGRVNAAAVAVMLERGIDISSHRAKGVAEALAGTAGPLRVAVAVCEPAAEACPRIITGQRLRIVSAPFDDPPALPAAGDDGYDHYRRVRDEIERWVREQLPQLLEPEPAVAASAPSPSIVVPAAAVATPDQAVDRRGHELSATAPAAESRHACPATPIAPVAGALAAPAAAGALPDPPSLSSGMGIFDRYLSVWVALCMLTGGLIGYFVPGAVDALARAQVAQVSVPIAVLLWLMIAPMLLQIDFAALVRVREQPLALLLATFVNWAIQPFTMFGLAVLFFRVAFTGVITDRGLADSYLAGCVLLGGAPCTAMVFVWSLLVGGDPGYTVVQIAVNDLLMLALYLPTVMLLLGVSSIPLPYDTIAVSVGLFIAAPLLVAALTRTLVVRRWGAAALDKLIAWLKPVVPVGLLATLVLIFITQGRTIGDKPLHIVLIMVPLLLQTIGIFALTYVAGYWLCVPHRFLAPAALIGTSNFFELAVACAIYVYGSNSGAALSTVVGVLVEVPIMLVLVKACHWLRPMLERHIATCECAWKQRLACCSGATARPAVGGATRDAVLAPASAVDDAVHPCDVATAMPVITPRACEAGLASPTASGDVAARDSSGADITIGCSSGVGHSAGDAAASAVHHA